MIGRWFALFFIFGAASFAWLILGSVTISRSSQISSMLRDEVANLWGRELVLSAPNVTGTWTESEVEVVTTTDATGKQKQERQVKRVFKDELATIEQTRATLDIHEDIRRKGLVWYPLYDASFAGTWTIHQTASQATHLRVVWPFPDATSDYDAFSFTVDGVPVKDGVDVGQARVEATIPTSPDAIHVVQISFRIRGSDQIVYRQGNGVGELRDFELTMTTDFADIDYPEQTLSPTTVNDVGDGKVLVWRSTRLVTGKGIGMVVPCPIQPGELAASLAFSAPISLGLFMVWIQVLGLLRGIDVHPINHVFLAGAFFGFHLLFAYSADWIPVEYAFAMSSIVSMFLVLTYLVRVVSARFAFVEAGIAQAVYLVGFAAAHFLDGMTGLTLTVIGIGTLFALMQMTAHIQWTALLAGDAKRPATI